MYFLIADNIILSADSYKPSHYLQIPEDTSYMMAYGEARGTTDPDFKELVFFGLQAYLRAYLTKQVTMADIDEAEDFILGTGEPFNRKGWERIVKVHGGYLPVKIDAIPEGSRVPTGVAMYTIENTDNELPWLPAYLETSLLRAVWYPTTVATYSYTLRNMLIACAKETGADLDVSFKMHDFGARGVSSGESAMLGGMAHLLPFKGTDTLEALYGARKYYFEKMAGFSIPAMEHGTVIIWGKSPKEELDAYVNMFKQFAKKGAMFAIVIDSTDPERAVQMIYDTLGEDLIKSGATLVLRPDSGNPLIEPICVINQAMSLFGNTVNDEGFRVLPPYIRVLQGDGIDKDSMKGILANLVSSNLSLDNLAFGQGGGLLQKHDRDKFMFAMKPSYAIVGDEGREIVKRPINDPSKASKGGRLTTYRKDGVLRTFKVEDIPTNPEEQGMEKVMRTVFLNGEVRVTETFAEIRERLGTT